MGLKNRSSQIDLYGIDALLTELKDIGFDIAATGIEGIVSSVITTKVVPTVVNTDL
jgi:hypothetical protein